MKSLYIINVNADALTYGIGSYMEQLNYLFSSLPFKINILTLNCNHLDETKIYEINSIRHIDVPAPPEAWNEKKVKQRYLKNVHFYLQQYISPDENIIFHFNFIHLGNLAHYFKETYTCKILLTVHYLSEPLIRLNSQKVNITKDLNEFREEEIRMLQLADQIICASFHSSQMVSSIYPIPASKLKMIPHGIEDRYQPVNKKEKETLRKKFGLENKEKIILFVGRIEPLKGIDYLIEAFLGLSEKDPDLRLIIAGKGNINKYMEKTFPVFPKVSFVGFLPKKEIHKLYYLADIGIVPSLYEEFGYVALEMMMIGLPIIVNYTSGLKELVSDKENGLYIHINPDNPITTISNIQEQIEELLSSPENQITYTRKGREIFSERFSSKQFNKAMLQVYTKIIGETENP